MVKGIKALSLFFIDEVAKYRQYDAQGNATGGTYAQIFEEEYKAIVGNMQLSLDDEEGYLLSTLKAYLKIRHMLGISQ